MFQKIFSSKKNYDLYFIIGYIAFLCATMLDTVPFIGGKNTTILNLIGIFFLSVYDIIQIVDKKRKTQILAAVSVLFIIIITFVSRTTYPLRLLLLIYGVKSFSFGRSVKIDLVARFILFAFVIFLFILQVIHVDPIYRYDGTIRYSFGFAHPNTFAIFMTSIIVDKLYLDYNKKNIKTKITNTFIIVISIIINVLYVDSRAALLMTIIISIFYYIPKTLLQALFSFKILKIILPFFMIILTATSFLLVLAYNSDLDFAVKINRFLSHRIHLWNQIIQNEFQITLLGFDTRNVMEHIPFDNAFLYSFYRFGIIFFLGLILLSYNTFKNLLLQTKVFAIAILISLFAYGTMESIAFYPGYSNMILLFSYGLCNTIFLKSPEKRKLQKTTKKAESTP